MSRATTLRIEFHSKFRSWRDDRLDLTKLLFARFLLVSSFVAFKLSDAISSRARAKLKRSNFLFHYLLGLGLVRAGLSHSLYVQSSIGIPVGILGNFSPAINRWWHHTFSYRNQRTWRLAIDKAPSECNIRRFYHNNEKIWKKIKSNKSWRRSFKSDESKTSSTFRIRSRR